MNLLSKLAIGVPIILGLLAGPFFSTRALAQEEGVSQETLESYEFNGQLGNEALVDPNAVANGLGGDAFTRNPSVGSITGANSINAQGLTTAQDPTGLIYSFGLDVDAGDTATISAISLAYRSSATGPGSVFLEESANGSPFTAITTLLTNSANQVNLVVPLSLTGLSGDVQFELVVANQKSTTGGALGTSGTFRVNDIGTGTNSTAPVTITGTVSGPVMTPGTIPGAPPTTKAAVPPLLQFSGSGVWGAGTPLTAYSASGENFSFSFDLMNPTESNPSAEVSNFWFDLNGVNVAVAGDTPFITFFDTAEGGEFDLSFPESGDDIELAGIQIGFDQDGSDTGGGPITVTPGESNFQITSDFEGSGSGTLDVVAIPEPSSLALLSAGALMLLGIRGIRRGAAGATLT